MTRTRQFMAALIVLLLALGASQPVAITHAQGGGTAYGMNTTGTISAETPLVLVSFNGAQGDLVQVDVLPTSGGLIPVVDLLAPDRQTVRTSRGNSLSTHTQDATLAAILPATGAYSLIIGGENGTTGDFVLQVQGRGQVVPTPLVFGQKIDVTIPQGGSPQYFSFLAEDCPTTLTVHSLTPAQPYTYPYIVTVRDERAQIVAVLRGGNALEDRVTVAPQSGLYEVEVWSDDPALAGMLSLLVTCADGTPACLAGDAAGAGVPGAVACPACPGCGDEIEEDPSVCDAFAVTVDEVDYSRITFSWPTVEGMEAVIYEVVAPDGTLFAARMMELSLGNNETVDVLTGGSGSYTIRVHAWTEAAGYICEDTVVVDVELGPVDWGPAVGCDIALVAPTSSMANGLQTFFWTDVEGAASYRLRLYNETGAVVAEGAMSAPATSMTLDASTASIGPGSMFVVTIEALQADGTSWCLYSIHLTRAAA